MKITQLSAEEKRELTSELVNARKKLAAAAHGEFRPAFSEEGEEKRPHLACHCWWLRCACHGCFSAEDDLWSVREDINRLLADRLVDLWNCKASATKGAAPDEATDAANPCRWGIRNEYGDC